MELIKKRIKEDLEFWDGSVNESSGLKKICCIKPGGHIVWYCSPDFIPEDKRDGIRDQAETCYRHFKDNLECMPELARYGYLIDRVSFEEVRTVIQMDDCSVREKNDYLERVLLDECFPKESISFGGTLKEISNHKWHIWFVRMKETGGVHGTGILSDSFSNADLARKVAKRHFGDKPLYFWIVSQTNPLVMCPS